MARRVNKTFVIGLGIVLLLLAGTVSVIVISKSIKDQDPAVLAKRAAEAETAGDIKSAMTFTLKAAEAASKKGTGNADVLYMKLGDLYMSQSGKDPNLFAAARKMWEKAQSENPKNMNARQRLLEESFKFAAFFRQQPTAWSQLEDAAKRVLALDPANFNARIYAAEAIIETLDSSSLENVVVPRLKEARSHLAAAEKVSPDSPDQVILAARLFLIESARASQIGQAAQAKTLRNQSLALLVEYTKKHPDEPTAHVALAQLYARLREPVAATAIMDQAYKANPKNPNVVYNYAELNRVAYPDRAEAALKNLVAESPTQIETRFRLATFYQNARRLPESVAEFKTILESGGNSAGIEGLKRSNWDLQAYYNVIWLSMDTAQQIGLTTPEGQNSLNQSADYLDRFRKLRPNNPLLDVLDGRMLLLRGNIPQAIAALKKADVNLGSSEFSQHWLNVKWKLAEAYKAQMEWGNTLAYLDQIQAKIPNYIPVLLEKAQVLNRIAEYLKALELVNAVLSTKGEENNQAAIRIKAGAQLGLNLTEEYKKTMARLNDAPSILLETARVELMSGDPQGALEPLERFLQNDPNNLVALNMAAVANIQLDRKDQALKWASHGLEISPKNTQFQMIKEMLEKPNVDPLVIQKTVIENIEDEYTRNMALAAFYSRAGDRKSELEKLYAAEKLPDSSGDRGRQQTSELVDRIFTVLMNNSLAASIKPAEKAEMFDTAKRYVEKAERLNLDGVNGKLYQGRLEIARGDKKMGINTLEQAVAARPDFSMAHTVLGQAYLDSGLLDAALAEFQKAIDQKPDNVMALKGAIILLERRVDPGSQNLTKNYLKQALTFAPRDRQLLIFADSIIDPAAALAQRQATYKRNPEDADNVRRLALLYVRFGNELRRHALDNQSPAHEKRAVEQFTSAATILKELADKSPNDLILADNLARMYRETQRTSDAILVYQRFIESKDQSVRYEALRMLGDMYRSLAQPSEAITTYKQAIESQPPGKNEAQRSLADTYFDQDDMKNAEILYSDIFTGSAKDMKVLRRWIETLVRQEKYVQAMELLDQQILAKNPGDEEGLVLKGFAQFRQRKAKDALESFNRVLDKNPGNLDALHYRALSQFFLQGDLAQAARDLIRIREQNKNAINSRLLLARVYRLARKYAEASSEYRDVVALRPELTQARLEYADYLLSLVELQTKMPPDSATDYAVSLRSAKPAESAQYLLDDSVRLFPDQVIWRVMQGNLMALRKNTAAAQKILEAAFKASGENPSAASAYLKALLDARNFDEVIQLSSRLLATRPDYGDYYIKRGTAYGAVQKPELALADFDKALALASKDLNLFLNVVRQTSAAVQVEPTIKHLSERLKAAPTDLPSRVGLAQSYLTANRFAEAFTTIEPLLKDPTTATIRPMLLRLAALALYQNKQFDKSLALYEELIKLEPEDLEALNNLAFLLAEDLKRPADGLVYADRAIKVLRTRPVDIVYVNNGNLLDTYGWVKFLNNDTDTAIRELNNALLIEPLPITYLHLAKAYNAQKRSSDAARVLKEGIRIATAKNDPVLVDLQKLQKEIGG